MILSYETQREVELFLLNEAKLLDAGEFEAWLELYEPAGIYWMPSQPGQTDANNVASIMYEDHAILAIRVRRLLEARALVLTPICPRSLSFRPLVFPASSSITLRVRVVLGTAFPFT